MENIKIDLKHKDTEAGWQKILDAFVIKATPKWFEWMGWLLILGALNYVAKETSSWGISLVAGLSFAFVLLYFQSFFFRFEFENLPFLRKNTRLARLISIIISGMLGVAVVFVLLDAVAELQP